MPLTHPTNDGRYILLVRSLGRRNLLLLLGKALREEGIVLGLLLLLAFDPAALERAEVAAALEADGGDQPLDLGTGSLLGRTPH